MEITKKSHWNILTTFGLLGIICLQNDVKAEDTPVDLSNLPELGTNVLNSGGSALIVTAGTEKKTAYFRFGGNPTKTNLWKWDIAVETPYDKNNNPSIPADFDGLTNSTTIQGNLSIIRIAKQEINNEFRTEMNKNCAKYLGQSTFVGGCATGDLTKWIKSLPEPQRQALCERYKVRDCSALAEVWKQMFVTERELLRADLEDRDVIEPVQAFISGVKAKIGKESFSFIEEIASDTSKANETPWSISAYGNIMRGQWIFGGGVEFQESFKEQSESSVCIPQTDPSGTLVKNGDPPALLGRHAEFDNFWNLIVTPECEPRSNTPRRNHETSRQFKSHTLGV